MDSNELHYSFVFLFFSCEWNESIVFFSIVYQGILKLVARIFIFGRLKFRHRNNRINNDLWSFINIKMLSLLMTFCSLSLNQSNIFSILLTSNHVSIKRFQVSEFRYSFICAISSSPSQSSSSETIEIKSRFPIQSNTFC